MISTVLQMLRMTEFQVHGPAMVNDQSPSEVCVRGTWSFPLSADLIPGRRLTLGWQNSARYSGVLLLLLVLLLSVFQLA